MKCHRGNINIVFSNVSLPQVIGFSRNYTNCIVSSEKNQSDSDTARSSCFFKAFMKSGLRRCSGSEKCRYMAKEPEILSYAGKKAESKAVQCPLDRVRGGAFKTIITVVMCFYKLST